MSRRNDIAIPNPLGGDSHFKLYEFENAEGLVMIHPSVIESLEGVRAELCEIFGSEVAVIITDAIRTEADLFKLALEYGWIDEGGKVSRDSKHLTKHGGIAVDFTAEVKETRRDVPQWKLGQVAARYFDWVKDDYLDGHVHADNRVRAN